MGGVETAVLDQCMCRQWMEDKCGRDFWETDASHDELAKLATRLSMRCDRSREHELLMRRHQTTDAIIYSPKFCDESHWCMMVRCN